MEPSPASQAVSSPASMAALVVLVIEDDASTRALLVRSLERDGHRVVAAHDGETGIELFESEPVDIVLLDMKLPGIDGLEVARRLKRSSSRGFVPVMFLTATTDEDELATCLLAGGDDFLVKPWRPVVLRAKIDALVRIRDLYRRASEQRDLLEQHQARLIREQEVAERLYSNMLGRAGTLPDVMKCMVSPAAIFSGDVVFHAETPSGGVRVLVGDFTGHGLQAAIGAMPVNDIFRSMTDKGFSIGDVIKELNQKLKAILPTRMFFACAILELVPQYDRLLLWNGGLPDVLVADANGQVLQRLPAQHLALGIQSSSQIDASPENIPIEVGQRVYVYSDGIVEASAPDEEMFGQERLEAFLSEHASSEDLFGKLGRHLYDYTGDLEQDDDFTLVEVRHLGDRASEQVSLPPAPARDNPPLHWSVSLDFEADTLRVVDPLPLLMQLTLDLQGLQADREKIYTVLAELYYNALDHGLLRLDSALKESPDGFCEYYSERSKRLADLQEGKIHVSLAHERFGEGGCLHIVVEDTGGGFDIEARSFELEENVSKSGRGLALVRTLTRELVYTKGGTRAEASFVWGNVGADS